MEKFIFDLDYTLLIPDWSCEDKFFKENLDKETYLKLKNVNQKILDEFETTYPKYDLEELSSFYKQHGIDLSTELIKKWMFYNGENIIDTVNDGAIPLLDYLKSQDKKIVLLTNWFSVTQIGRLKRSGLYDYFDSIICGDQAMKSSEKSFELAVGNTPKSECIMIGDNKIQDYENALKYGINAYLLSDKNSLVDLLNDIKGHTMGGI